MNDAGGEKFENISCRKEESNGIHLYLADRWLAYETEKARLDNRANREKELSAIRDGDRTSGVERLGNEHSHLLSTRAYAQHHARLANEAGVPPKTDRVVEVPDDPFARRPHPTKHCQEQGSD